ncbi:helix-turn-helix domain-containing protein [Evansella tamaricis]|uniref:Helix-turn-helix domain-containing protein n=1 Tax=Evansella tamaricis TaxID=2069301 RepID=A0ABS6J9N9_9BACI|nr:helix-turn-helix domain-containing protein [Evansella tamaricis]MBU9710402.1 helix-turn-helix domain-containing protein [Evansella tamaricis]
MDNLADQLRGTMERRGMTREELAAVTGISEDVLATIEANSDEVSVSDLQKISSALNMSFHIGDTSI